MLDFVVGEVDHLEALGGLEIDQLRDLVVRRVEMRHVVQGDQWGEGEQVVVGEIDPLEVLVVFDALLWWLDF